MPQAASLEQRSINYHRKLDDFVLSPETAKGIDTHSDGPRLASQRRVVLKIPDVVQRLKFAPEQPLTASLSRAKEDINPESKNALNRPLIMAY